MTFLPVLKAAGGYGLHSTQYVTWWDRWGLHVSVRAIEFIETQGAEIPFRVKRRFVHCEQPEDWELILSPPNYRPHPEKRTAYFTMNESSLWSPLAVNYLKRCELAIVPCRWNMEGLRASGIDVPVALVPLGADPEVFRPSPMNMDGPCVFGAAGYLMHGYARKGLNAVINAFTKEFSKREDVLLRLKGFSDAPIESALDERITIFEGFLPAEKLARWFSNLTCFVSAAKSEGWGLMQLEAMMSGRPVIASIYGGLAEFMTPENSYGVNFKEEAAKDAWGGLGMWAQPDEDHLRFQMRWVYENRAAAQKRGLDAAQSVAHLTWENSAMKTLEALERVGAL